MELRLVWDGGRTEQPTDISAYQAAIGVERGRLVPVRPARILGDTETRLAWTRLMVGQGVFFANAKKSHPRLSRSIAPRQAAGNFRRISYRTLLRSKALTGASIWPALLIAIVFGA